VCRSWRWLNLGKVAVVVDRAFFREAQVNIKFNLKNFLIRNKCIYIYIYIYINEPCNKLIRH
jgi:hypothetical protein